MTVGVKPLPKEEIKALKNLSGKTDQEAQRLGEKEALVRKQTYSEEETLNLGWKVIRNALRGKGILPKEGSKSNNSKPLILTPAQVKEYLFQAWLENRIEVK